MIKTNEISGRATHNHDCKPTMCQSSKQYLCIGGARPNQLSLDFLKAAALNDLAQPVVTVILKPDADEIFTRQVFETMTAIWDKMQVYHYDVIHRRLLNRGLPETIAVDFTFSGCCTLDFHYRTIRNECYFDSVRVLCDVLGLTADYNPDYGSVEDVVAAIRGCAQLKMQAHVNQVAAVCDAAAPAHQDAYRTNRKKFVLDALLMGTCAERCRYPFDGGSCDVSGVTATLKSVAKLPLHRTANGGLNLMFAQKVSADILQSLILAYFKMGGIHAGVSVTDIQILKDAMIRPEKYKSLTVRLYGFSEYFISLPEWQKIALMNRTRF